MENLQMRFTAEAKNEIVFAIEQAYKNDIQQGKEIILGMKKDAGDLLITFNFEHDNYSEMDFIKESIANHFTELYK